MLNRALQTVSKNTELAVKFSEISYISNILSLARIVLAFPIYYLLTLESEIGNYLAVLVMVLAALTDAYDGRLARKLKQKSELGRILDPIADKLCLGIIAVMLVRTRELPLWFVLFAIGRDLAIVVLAILLSFKTRQVVESNMLGKITVTVLAFTVAAYTLELSGTKEIFLWCSVVFLIASSVSYTRRLQSKLKPAHQNLTKSNVEEHSH